MIGTHPMFRWSWQFHPCDPSSTSSSFVSPFTVSQSTKKTRVLRNSSSSAATIFFRSLATRRHELDEPAVRRTSVRGTRTNTRALQNPAWKEPLRTLPSVSCYWLTDWHWQSRVSPAGGRRAAAANRAPPRGAARYLLSRAFHWQMALRDCTRARAYDSRFESDS